MEDCVTIKLTGDMEVPKDPPRDQGKQLFDGFNLSSVSELAKLEKIPSVMEVVQIVRQSVRPWSEFLNTSNFKTAASMPRLTSRFVRNLKHFQGNYAFMAILLMVYALITSPLVLLVLGGVLYASHKIRNAQAPVTIMGLQLNPNHQIMIINVASIPILILAGAGAAIFWTLGASCFFIALHALFYNIDAIVTEETEGFLSQVV